MHSGSDQQLVQRARAGERDAFDQLVLRYQGEALRVAYAIAGDHAEAQDLAQEAFLRAWQNLHVLSDPEKFSAWLRRIVFGVTIDWLRAFRADLFRLADDSAELALLSYPAPQGNALEQLEATDLRKRVWQAIGRLPENYRLPLTMFHFDGLSHARVARALSIPEGTVRSLVSRARARLRPMLGVAIEVLEETTMTTQGIVHICDGDSVAGTLRQSGLPGEVAVYGDLLYEGPVPKERTEGELLALRSRFHAQAGYGAAKQVEAWLKKSEETIAGLGRHQEVILWFDHRLSDQLLLIRLLDRFHDRRPGETILSLICVGSYPPVAPFVGLGQLTSDQLFSLADTRSRIGEEQMRLGRAAWRAFTSADPTSIENLLRAGTRALPFLAPALRRHLEQFPSAENGLSRTEQAAMEILAEREPMPAIKLFFAVQAKEDPLFMGDSSFYRLLKKLASEKHPLISVGKLPGNIEEWHKTEVLITPAGRTVREAKQDRIRLNGIDEWLGGAHLVTGGPLWRWDSEGKRLRSE
jgi:RNA polymerase sigma factor (sigma-70 family)